MTDTFRDSGMKPVLAAVAAAITLFALAFVGADRVLAARTQPGSRDVDLFAAIVARVANGQPYYRVVAEELPARGYPVRPVFAWRLPTLPWFLASVGTRGGGQAALWIIGALAIVCWARVLHLRAGSIALVLIAPLWLLFSSAAVYMFEIWAGQLVALGIALWLLNRRHLALVALVAAALVREHAALALALVAFSAWREKQPVRPWAVGLIGVVAVYSAHIAAAVQHTPPGGITHGWGGLPGWAFIVSAAQAHVLLVAAPYWVTALVVAVCVPALWLWRNGRLVAIIVTTYAALFVVAARPDNWYWGLVILPLMPLGCIALIHETIAARHTRAGRATRVRPA